MFLVFGSPAHLMWLMFFCFVRRRRLPFGGCRDVGCSVDRAAFALSQAAAAFTTQMAARACAFGGNACWWRDRTYRVDRRNHGRDFESFYLRFGRFDNALGSDRYKSSGSTIRQSKKSLIGQAGWASPTRPSIRYCAMIGLAATPMARAAQPTSASTICGRINPRVSTRTSSALTRPTR